MNRQVRQAFVLKGIHTRSHEKGLRGPRRRLPLEPLEPLERRELLAGNLFEDTLGAGESAYVGFSIGQAILAGDYNGNGQVEQGDLDLELLHWGGDAIPATWTNNPPSSAVDQQDLDAVLLHWGSGVPLAATSVREPSGLLLALITLAVSCWISSRPRRMFRPAVIAVLCAAACMGTRSVHAFRVLDATLTFGLGIDRWDAAPLNVDGVERSLDGGLRYSLSGGSYEAFRNLFQWQGTPPSVSDFQIAVEQAFAVWEAVDPTTGLGTDLRFVPDFDTPVFLEPQPTELQGYLRLNPSAEIDIFADPFASAPASWDAFTDTYVDPHANSVTLTTGASNYPAAVILGADISLRNSRMWTLEYFQSLLSHEIGHALGLDDVDRYHDWDAGGVGSRFNDDNYDGTSRETSLDTLTNSFADLIDPLDPDNSPALLLFDVCTPTDPNNPNSCVGRPGIDTPGVNLLMESSPNGRRATSLQNDDFAARQFLYPFISAPLELAGDYNGNGHVEQGDLDLVLLNWGSDTIPAAWTNSPPESAVDQQELDAVLLHWGSGAPLGAASVPEPSGLLLALAALLVVCIFVRSRIARTHLT